MKRCPQCNQEKDSSEFFKNAARHDGLSGYCRVCQTKANNAHAVALRLEVMDLLGGRRCVRCRYDDVRALIIDHKNGGGTRHRVDAVSSWAIYRHAKAHPDEYQVLCWNCNHIKRIEDGEHGNYAADLPIPERVVRPPRWARDYDACTSCSTTETPHKAGGLCRNCFQRDYRRRNPATTSSATT